MSSYVTSILSSTMASRAAQEMESGDFRHLPVVDGDNKLVGMLSDRDVIRASSLQRDANISVGDVMSNDVYYVYEHSSAAEALALMMDHKIGAVPVVDPEQHVIGIVTTMDALRIAYDALGGDIASED